MGAQFPGIGAHGDERAGASPVLPTRLQVLPRLQDTGRHAQEALQALRPPDSEPPRVAAAWEHITRIREYADKGALRTVSEWRHSAVKIIDPCGLRNERG
ncbi:hypothetical protein PF008_g8320 [Phytophthora fragariae]|uniref:Uncharacterized protein n=1 Tax=Phytophthora fragariae TaxID=53985 RepID=A0A6G0S0H6_9STRA|nr:hypothetical protein PF008_g8320 [Phytophthora fragariae]